jgi:hypothetical protein
MSIDPLRHKYAGWSSYNYVMGNPLSLIDPDGREPNDIVYFNSQGVEVSRIVSDKIFETHVDFLGNGIYSNVPMPNIVRGFENPKYQKYDYLIAAHTAIFNKTGMALTSTENGLYLDGDMPKLSPTLVKSIILKETQAGQINGQNGQNGKKDIMQSNVTTSSNGVETGSDWGDYKAKLGLTKGGSASPSESIYAGIRMLFMKGLQVAKVEYENGGKTLSPNSEVTWRGGNLNNWWNAVQSYNGNFSNYANTVYGYWNNSFFTTESKHYVEQK